MWRSASRLVHGSNRSIKHRSSIYSQESNFSSYYRKSTDNSGIGFSSFSRNKRQKLAFSCRAIATSCLKETQARWVNPKTGEYVGLNLNEDEKKRRAIENSKMLRRRMEYRQRNMSDEAKLMWKLETTRRKLAIQRQRLESLALAPEEESEHDPEILTPEQLYALKKIANMNRNYVPVGVRGIFGGTIENMHQHWKFHETCQVDLHMFHKSKIKGMAQELARLSGGIAVDIIGTTVYMYRGRNYRQPNELIPENQHTKRQALFKARFTQSKEALEGHISRLAARLERLRQESDVAGLVEKIAFVKPPRKRAKQDPPLPKVSPEENEDLTEDEFGDKDAKYDTDDNLVGGESSSDEFDGEYP